MSRRFVPLALLVLSCANDKAAQRDGVARAPAAPVVRAAPFEKEVLGWVVLKNLDGSLSRLAGHLGAGEGGPEGIKHALAARFTGEPELGQALDTTRPVAAVMLDPASQKQAPPYVLRVPLASRERFLEGMASAFRRVTEPGAERHVFEMGTGGRIYVAFEGAPAAESALIAFRPGYAAQSVSFFAAIAGRPRADVTLRVDLERMQENHERELAGTLVKLLVMSSPGAIADPRSAHATRLVRRALGFVQAAQSLEARLDFTDTGAAIALRLEVAADDQKNRLSAHIAEQEPAPVWGVEVVPEDAMLVYATHTTRESRQADARDLVQYVSGQIPDANQPADADEEATGLAIDAFGDALQGDAIYAVWPGKDGGIGVGGALRVKGGSDARKRAMDAYAALGQNLGRTTARELGLDPKRFRFHAKVKRGAARAAGQSVDVIELSPSWPANSGAHKRQFKWLFGDRLTLGMAFVGEHALYAAGRDWEDRLASMVKSAQGHAGSSIARVPAFARAVELHPDGRISMAYVSTQGMAEFVARVVRATSKLQPEQQAMLDPFLQPGTDADAFVASTNVKRDGRRAVYELNTQLPANAIAELGRLGGAMWRVGLAPIFGPPAMPPLPTPPANVTPPPPGP